MKVLPLRFQYGGGVFLGGDFFMNFDKKNSKREIVWQDPNHIRNTESEQNQSVQQMSPEIRNPCVYPSPPDNLPYYPNEWGAISNPIAMAGVNKEQAQNLNFLFIKNQLELMQRQADLNMQFQHQYNLQLLKNANRLPPEENVPITSPKIAIDHHIADFI